MGAETSPVIHINSLAEGKSYEAQGFISPEELGGLAREAFLLGRIPQEEYASFVHENAEVEYRNIKRDLIARPQTIRNSKIVTTFKELLGLRSKG